MGDLKDLSVRIVVMEGVDCTDTAPSIRQGTDTCGNQI